MTKYTRRGTNTKWSEGSYSAANGAKRHDALDSEQKVHLNGTVEATRTIKLQTKPKAKQITKPHNRWSENLE